MEGPSHLARRDYIRPFINSALPHQPLFQRNLILSVSWAYLASTHLLVQSVFPSSLLLSSPLPSNFSLVMDAVLPGREPASEPRLGLQWVRFSICREREREIWQDVHEAATACVSSAAVTVSRPMMRRVARRAWAWGLRTAERRFRASRRKKGAAIYSEVDERKKERGVLAFSKHLVKICQKISIFAWKDLKNIKLIPSIARNYLIVS